MNEEYLWDRTGSPDRDVERLERLLAPARHQAPPPAWPERPRARGAWPFFSGVFAAAATLLITVGVVSFVLRAGPAGWDVRAIEGTVAQSRLAVGGWLVTDERSRALIVVPALGQVEVEPRTRLRLRSSDPQNQMLELARGEIQATVSAPPRIFFVDTPTGRAVDLGCRYRLEVDDAGSSRLHVTLGKVELERDGRSAYVPAGAICRSHKERGLGVPFFDDASPTLVAAVLVSESGKKGKGGLGVILKQAKDRDTLTLFHLLDRVPKKARGRVCDRLMALVTPPADVTKAALMALEREALAKYREKLLLFWW